jgi:hypothetical protein
MEVVEARLKARQPLLAALGRELVLLEGLVVALERVLGAGDLGADRVEALLDLGPVAFRFCLFSPERLRDQVAVAVDAGRRRTWRRRHSNWDAAPAEQVSVSGVRVNPSSDRFRTSLWNSGDVEALRREERRIHASTQLRSGHSDGGLALSLGGRRRSRGRRRPPGDDA